ncbi:MAG: biotin--[acetyl-CoA-carboxylase] ligase [Bacteroidota bacterium]
MTILNNTLLIGKVFHHFESLDSTNTYALDLASKSRPAEGALIMADFQSAGRGQFGRTWESAHAENLMISVILYPTFLPADRQFCLNQAVSLGVYETLAAYPLSDVAIKWPNDLYVGDRKIGGMLIQNVLRGRHLETSVIGIGLNINQGEFARHLDRATSLRMETGQQFDRFEVLSKLAKNLEVHYLALRAGKQEELQSKYLSKLKYYNIWQRYQDTNGKQFMGKIIGVEPDGRLLVEMDNSETRSFVFQEIAVVF